MTPDDVFQQTDGVYLRLIHPLRVDNAYREEIAPLLKIGPLVPDQLIVSMILGAYWRERLAGLCLAMSRQKTFFIEPIFQSLRDPRPIAIVPAFAALAVLSQQGHFTMEPSFRDMFDRNAWDMEVGWATDQAMYYAGLSSNATSGTGPNYGQIFEDHIEVYGWVSTM